MQTLQGLQDGSEDSKFEKESSHPCQEKGMKIQMHYHVLAIESTGLREQTNDLCPTLKSTHGQKSCKPPVAPHVPI